VGLVAVFGLSYLGEVWPDKGASLRDKPPTAIERLARNSAKRLVSWVSALNDMEPTTAKLSAALVSEPRKVISHVQNLQQNPDMQKLFSDAGNQATLRSGDPQAIQQLPAFQNLVDNKDVQALMEASGYESGPEADVVLAEQISHLSRRAELIKNDKQVRAILDDPEFQQQLQSGNPALLLNNKDFVTLLNLLTRDLPTMSTPNSPVTIPPQNEPTIYRWVDDEGKVHYGDRKPESAQ